jgi:uncharacterized protein (DUF2235 family)
MGRNIVVCCDGTANEFTADRTNVLKLFFTLVQDPARQAAFYHPGVGTMEPPGVISPLRKKIMRLAGLAFGAGLESDICDAYAYVMNNFEEGDRLYLFGFSRGAYAARAVASLIKMYGLMRKGSEPLIPYALRMMAGVNNGFGGKTDAQKQAIGEVFELASEFKAYFSQTPCAPHFVGVWDTVSSVGWIDNPIHLPYTADNPDILHGRHAVSIDERRAFFRTNLWRPKNLDQDIVQVWFPGVHCDVGGGYAEAESGLAKGALAWMLREAQAHGLLCEPEKVALMLGEVGGGYVKPDPNGPMHDELKGLWRLAEYLPKRRRDPKTGEWERRCNRGRKRSLPPQSMIHVSAYERGGGYGANLPADAIKVN